MTEEGKKKEGETKRMEKDEVMEGKTKDTANSRKTHTFDPITST